MRKNYSVSVICAMITAGMLVMPVWAEDGEAAAEQNATENVA